ncbi:5'/3'-nucleotidase SurE [Paractinoplanes toevensis]|uniref:5'-nucleotidase n=1 Tax=Paractinoplanes toevensis TaxID=571911 RepID=A0A919TAK2_9ACTN|nr:5'/3'-nucleotidase SurE [Actinoplanes toevensis]GIM91201.1 5'/3'-nucleotidase SurE [Actinoplanes toevensis]
MTRVLITNDDGVDAPGIRALAEAVRGRGYDTVVAAPAEEQSGMSAALTAVTEGGRVAFETRPPGYAVAASPAYIVMLAFLGVFGPPPDVVLSGINRGANTGRAVLHSGTVGAALTAANHGARALAISLDVIAPGELDSGGTAFTITDDASLHWTTAADLAADLVDWLTESPPGTVANLNVPDRAGSELAGLRRATLANFGQVRMAVAEQGADFARLTLERGDPADEGSDVALLEQGFAALTALRPVAEAANTAIPTQRAPH